MRDRISNTAAVKILFLGGEDVVFQRIGICEQPSQCISPVAANSRHDHIPKARHGQYTVGEVFSLPPFYGYGK